MSTLLRKGEAEIKPVYYNNPDDEPPNGPALRGLAHAIHETITEDSVERRPGQP